MSVIGDKAYISEPVQVRLKRDCQLVLLTNPRRNQKVKGPTKRSGLINHFRQIIETVNGQLAEQFNIEINRAHSFWGLCARLNTKLAGHTLSIYFNRVLGNADFLKIKALAFPN
jgi:hypothetical protein